MRLVNKAILGTAMAVIAIGAGSFVDAQSTPQPRKGSAENKLVGIALYDTGTKVVSVYGSPDEIQALSIGATTGAGGGAGGGDGRGGSPSGGGGGGAESAGPAPPPPAGVHNGLIGDPFGPGTEWKQARAPRNEGAAGAGGGDTGGTARPGGGGSAGSVGGGGDGKVVYTRWIYKRSNSRYAFVLDKFNRVIQIEAVGLRNSSVKTRRGMTFGSSFSSIIKAYGAPDGYEISGDTVVVRYLVRDHVAFRLSRLDAKKPQVVTGIVVAAGKT